MTYRRRYFDGEVTEPEIASEAVTEEKIADGAVTSEKIKDETIKSVDIGSGQVGTDDIADGAVTLAKLGSNVSIIPLQDGAVTTTKLADGAVTEPKIGNREVTEDKIKEGAVSSLKLKDGAVIASKIGTGAVTNAKIIDSAITPSKLYAIDTPADGEVPTYNQAQSKFEWKPMSGGGGITRPITPGITGDEITDQAVSETKIADLAVTSGKIQDSCVKPSKLASANAPSNGAILAYNESGSNFQWIGASGGDMLTLLQSQTMVLTDQSANNVDQIVDLPGFIPPVVKAVILEIQFNAMSVPLGLEQILTVYGRRAGTDWGQSMVHFIWQNIPNLNNNVYKECIVATDLARQIRVIINKGGQFCSTNIWIRGYVE
ncbi:MAG: hypothetical protein V1701_08225 [Planctomycetota bacterium]